MMSEATGEPKKFAFDVILHVNEFEADSPEEAEEMLDKYIDRLAKVEDKIIRWESLDTTGGDL
jgi:formyltetrahydrofolate synthetase